MKINEALESVRAKQEYRELAQKYHSDKDSGDHDIMVDINAAKDEGDEAIHKLYKKLVNKLKQPHAPIFNGTERSQIEQWTKEIASHYPGLIAIPQTDSNGGVFIRLAYRVDGEPVVKFVMHAQICKTMSDLAKKIKEVLLS